MTDRRKTQQHLLHCDGYLILIAKSLERTMFNFQFHSYDNYFQEERQY
jgi:hypothetical protein